jgi:hypothetical protein
VKVRIAQVDGLRIAEVRVTMPEGWARPSQAASR